MAKSLNDILKRFEDVISGKLPPSKIEPLTTGDNPGVDYADKMKDGRDFVGMHTVQKHPDRNGNGDDVFKGSTTKAKMERHGHEPKPKDIKVYNKTQQVSEAKDNREYDYEGEMAVTKLKTIVRAAEHLIKMMEPNTNLPEWVQSKIIKAEDYITTAHDYLMSEMNEEVEQIDEVTASINHKYVPEKWGEKSGKVKKIIDSLEKAKIPHSVAHLGGDRNSGITYVTSDHPKFASHMEKLAKKADTYDPKIYVHGVNEEVEELDELTGYRKKNLFGKDKLVAVANRAINRMKLPPNNGEKLSPKDLASNKKNSKVSRMAVDRMEEEVELDEGGSQYRSTAGSGKNTNPNLSRLARKLAFEKPKSYRPPGEKSKAENRAILDAEVAKFMKKGGKIRKEEVEELDEAKCNMSEAGTMCEVHGMKACSKEETKPSDKQPMYNGKDKNKKGRQLILDKDLKEMATSQNQAIAARIALKHKREGTMPPKGTASHSMMGMSEKQLHDYTKAEKGAPKKVEESVSDQRSARSTASEKAREKIANALERKKLEKMKHKLKTEQSAPAETVIRMPSGDVGDTGRV